MTSIQIPNHAHCTICGRAVPYGDKTCGPEDQAKLDGLQKKRRNTLLFMYAMMGLAAVLLVLNLKGVVK